MKQFLINFLKISATKRNTVIGCGCVMCVVTGIICYKIGQKKKKAIKAFSEGLVCVCCRFEEQYGELNKNVEYVINQKDESNL